MRTAATAPASNSLADASVRAITSPRCSAESWSAGNCALSLRIQRTSTGSSARPWAPPSSPRAAAVKTATAINSANLETSELQLRAELDIPRLKNIQRLQPRGPVGRVDGGGRFAGIRGRADRGVGVERVEDVGHHLHAPAGIQADILRHAQIELRAPRRVHRAGLDERHDA